MRLLRYPAVVTALLCALGAGGCSFQMHSLLSADDADVDQTGSIARSGDRVATVDTSESDLAYASAVAVETLAHGKKDSSVPWQNPETGATGNITPLATAYTAAGLPCRDFLASYVHGQSQDWLQGAACRTNAGKWEVKRLKPLSRS